ncbi:sarcosine oxidase subunit gamma SoxG, partial [bacterium]|nr:sarcosine oxidase subunit gamma SoxG [bacterium]
MMKTNQRYSPVQFEIRPDQTEIRDGWEVVLQYSDKGKRPFLVDLSHRKKWDVQDSNLSKIQ